MCRRARNYLQSHDIKAWHDRYARFARDTLVHRVPMYLPPFLVKTTDAEDWQALERAVIDRTVARDFAEADALESRRDGMQVVCDFISLPSGVDAGLPFILFHAQVLADIQTVLEVYRVGAGAWKGA